MAKAKKDIYFCKECGTEVVGWMGRCPGCGEWNTMVEAPKETKPANARGKRAGGTAQLASELVKSQTQGWLSASAQQDQIIDLTEVSGSKEQRLKTGDSELDRVLGGGLVKGSLVLLGGDPGIGKSTLLLQVLGHLALKHKCLYISGEESPAQIKLRAERLKIKSKAIRLLLATDFSVIAQKLAIDMPELVIIDSIQTIFVPEIPGAPGSVSQVREATAGLLRIAKDLGITVVLVGHVTKEGSLAGPRILEHMVDTVLYFEGEGLQQYRVLRAVKNRFGTTDEVGVFEMNQTGLSAVQDVSATLLAGRPQELVGSAVTAGIEGTRAILLEIQALIASNVYSQPLRMAQGIDRMRFSMLLAVLGKMMNQSTLNSDAYINVAGGLKIKETAADLAVLMAVVSSMYEKPIKQSVIILGEVGLSGEVRGILNVEKRVNEARRLGWRCFVLPEHNRKELQALKDLHDCEIKYVAKVQDALHYLFG